MLDQELRVRGRLPDELLVRHERSGVTLTENRHPAWAKLFLVAAVCGLLTAALLYWQRNHPDTVSIVAWMAGILFGVPLGIAGLLVLPWNRQVVVDVYDGSCCAQRRFYSLPYRSRNCSLWHGSLVVVPVLHTRLDTVQKSQRSSTGNGCLMILLGPIGTLIAGLEVASSVRRIQEPAWALVYLESGTEPQPRILIACRNDAELREAEAAYQDWLQQMGRA